jgi:hypothetical protein
MCQLMGNFDADIPLRMRTIDAELERSKRQAMMLITAISLLAVVLVCSVLLGVSLQAGS